MKEEETQIFKEGWLTPEGETKGRAEETHRASQASSAAGQREKEEAEEMRADE